MREIQSSIEGKTASYKEMKNFFEKRNFVIGGNWDYDAGFFDFKLDSQEEKHGEYVYLRIPGYAREGQFGNNSAKIEIGKPFVLVHRFESNNDLSTTNMSVMNSMINQFQSPVQKDAPVEDVWMVRGERKVREIEQDFPFH